VADDMGLPPVPEGRKKQHEGTSLPGFPSKSASSSKTHPIFHSKAMLKKSSAGKFTSAGSNQRKTEQEVKEKLQRELEAARAGFDSQKQELKKEIEASRRKLEKEKADWNRIVEEKESEVKKIKAALNGKTRRVKGKITEAGNELRKKLSREHSRLLAEKKTLEKSNLELESRLKEIESGWKGKEQEVRELQKKALKELKNAEGKLQEERERTWFKTLKVKEDELNSLKVELTLQESRLRALFEKKQEEIKEIELRSQRIIKEKAEQGEKEKESILNALSIREKEINALKETFSGRERQLAEKVEETELEGRLALAKFEQDLKEREKNIWVEREEWITVLKTQFKEKENSLKEQLEKEKAGLKEKENIFNRERDKLLELLNARDGELKAVKAEYGRLAEAGNLETLRKVKENENLWRNRVTLKETELEAQKSELARREKSLSDALLQKGLELKEAREAFLTEKTVLTGKLSLEDNRLSSEITKKEQEYRYFVSEFEGKEKQYKKMLEEQSLALRKLEEDRISDFLKERERLKNIENSLTERESEKRLLETELNRKNRVIFEKEEKLQELELSLHRLEHEKNMLAEDLTRSQSEINRAREGNVYELNALKEDRARLEKTLAEKAGVLEASGKAALLAEIEDLKVEIKRLKEQGLDGGTLAQLTAKDTLIQSLNETLGKIEKEKAAMKDLILEKSEAEEIKKKEMKDLMDTVSNLTENQNKYDFKTKELASDRETALNELSAAQSRIAEFQKEAEGLKRIYEERLEAEQKQTALEIEKVKIRTEEYQRLTSLEFENEKKRFQAELENLRAELLKAGSALAEALEVKETSAKHYEERMLQLKEEIDRRDSELDRIKNGIDSNISGLEAQNKYIEGLKNEIAVAAEKVKRTEEEALAVKEGLKNKEVENKKLEVELGGLLNRSEELLKLAGEKDEQITALTTDFNGKLGDLSEVLRTREKDLENAKTRITELEQRVTGPSGVKEDELRLAISRLQMQLKEAVGRYETEIKAEKQKLQSIQAEYALHEAMWVSQKDKEKEARGQMADMDASFAKLRKDASDNAAKFALEVENAREKLAALEVRTKESDEKLLKSTRDNDILFGRLLKETQEKERLVKKYGDAESKLKGLRKKLKFFLWLWYPNEPRD